ncbi:unnamed protein product, partial [Mesorhabditis spiculigera]
MRLEILLLAVFIPTIFALPSFTEFFDPSKWDFNAGLKKFNSWLSADDSASKSTRETCFSRIKDSLKTDHGFDQALTRKVKEGKVEEAVEETLAQAGKICDAAQQQRMIAFFHKYGSSIMNAKDILAEVHQDERVSVCLR